MGVVSEYPFFFRPSAEIIKGIERAASALEERGATIVPFVPAHTRELIALYLQALSADGGDTLRNMLGEDPPSAQLKTLLRLAKLRAASASPFSRAGSSKASDEHLWCFVHWDENPFVNCGHWPQKGTTLSAVSRASGMKQDWI